MAKNKQDSFWTSYSDLMTSLFFVMLVAAFTGTVLFPIKNLRKMKIAEQIKYE